MASTAFRLALVTMLLGSSAVGAHAGWFDLSSKKAPAKEEKPAAAAASTAGPGTNLEDSVRQAHMLRLAGNYPEAIKHLSQVMMVASDDPRVVSEYGKTLAAMGRAQDAINFLSRAAQLEPGDWTVFSALGVAYDQVGNQKDAQSAYEHALAIKPGEPSVLSNYALSRMLAHDPAMAKALASRAEIANAAASDAKITANIAMIRSMAPDPAQASFAVNTPAPKPMASAPMPAPRVPVAANPMPAPFIPMAGNAPRPLPQPSNIGPANAGVIDSAPQMAAASGVVMQRVPVDPLAGPVNGRTIAAKAPVAKKTVARNVAKAPEKKDDALDMSTARSESPKPAAMPAPGVKTAATQAEDLQARAEAMAKQLTNKPAAIAAAQVQANKPEAGKPTMPHVLADKAVPAPVKAAEAKPAPAPHVLPQSAPSKTAAAPTPKVLPAPAKTTAKAKDTIPGLRLSANAY